MNQKQISQTIVKPLHLSKVYLYKKWKFKLIGNFARKKKEDATSSLLFSSHRFSPLLPFPFCSVYLTRASLKLTPCIWGTIIFKDCRHISKTIIVFTFYPFSNSISLFVFSCFDQDVFNMYEYICFTGPYKNKLEILFAAKEM